MKRPWAVTLVAVLEFLAAAVACAVSFSLFVPGTWLDRMWNLNAPAHDALAAQAHPVATLLLLVGALAAAAVWVCSRAVFGHGSCRWPSSPSTRSAMS
jgi:hypothetical protein